MFRVLMAVVALGLASASGAAASDPPGSPAAGRVVWTTVPDGAQLGAHYPKRAAEAGVEGRSTLECTIADDGALSGCRVAAESPPDLGFGQAALELAPLFRARTTDTAGGSATGRRVRVPIGFSLPQDPAELAQDVKLETPGVAQKPIPTSRVKAAYPPAARQAGANGEVKVRGEVGADGALSAIAVEESSGSSDLDQAATEAFGRWVFQPGLDASKKPVASTVAVTFVFDIDLKAASCAEAAAQVRWFAKAFPQKTVKDSRLYIFTRTFLGMEAAASGAGALQRFAHGFQPAFDKGLEQCAGRPDANFYGLVKSLL